MKGVHWTGNSRWMPVTIGLVGHTFNMRAIGPTLRLTSPFMVRLGFFALSFQICKEVQLVKQHMAQNACYGWRTSAEDAQGRPFPSVRKLRRPHMSVSQAVVSEE